MLPFVWGGGGGGGRGRVRSARTIASLHECGVRSAACVTQQILASGFRCWWGDWACESTDSHPSPDQKEVGVGWKGAGGAS